MKRLLIIIAALLQRSARPQLRLAAGASPITEKVLGAAGIAQRLAVQGLTGRTAHIAQQ